MDTAQYGTASITQQETLATSAKLVVAKLATGFEYWLNGGPLAIEGTWD